ncbi:phage portal protein [Frigoribacterium faeni]|uniref:Phage portal protein n=1 Tax=Frigoribacterium faeni TaxID=145483 RepID=A0A7W3JGL2_9MICO|nr:phage portal protein [Frigoribacterium faeni]MBA8812423.1 HK97 family phage portal protein [Frigoribacterium faeni]BFF13496.1 phage portal protein [Microbacterium flavescens]GEK81860.1 phage portal protein [Frigoribacterium faeni]
MSRFGDWFWGVESRADSTVTPPDSTSADNRLAHRIPSRAPSATGVTTEQAVTLGTVYRAVALISTAAKQVSLDVYRGDRLVANSPTFIRQPSADMSQRSFVETTVTSMALTGNAFWRVDRDASGKVLNVTVLDPQATQVDVDSAGTVKGYRTGSDYLRPERVRHLRLTRIPGQALGLGPIQAAQSELRGAIDTRDYAANWFRDTDTPTGILKSDQSLTPESAEEAKARWENNGYGVRVLGNGLNYNPIFLSPEDAQWIEAQRFSTTGIARIFGIPAALLLADVQGTSQTYSNVSQAWTEFARFSLTAYVSEIEDALSTLVPGLGVVRGNFEGLLRADTTTRYAAHAVALGAGFVTVNEVRAIEGLAPLAGGDDLKSASPAPTPETPEVTE